MNDCLRIMPKYGGKTLVLVVVGLLACYALLQLHVHDGAVRLLSNSATVGGLLSGGLHALTGSDHLAALLPLIFGRRWWRSGCVGAAWGLGHGLTSALIGFLSCSMKRFVLRAQSVQGLGDVADAAVGVTLVIIGVMGYYEGAGHEEAETEKGEKGESEGSTADTESCAYSNGDEEAATLAASTDADTQTPSSIPGRTGLAGLAGSAGSAGPISGPIVGIATQVSVREQREQRGLWALGAVLVNGCVLGLSWDGLPSLAPAVVLDQPGLLRFLLAYAIATAFIMALAAGLVGESTCWVRRVAKEGFSERLAAASSLLAVAMGVCWVVAAAARLLCLHLHLHLNLLWHAPSLRFQEADVMEGNDGSGYPGNDGSYHSTGVHHSTTSVHAALGGASLLAVLGVLLYALRSEFGPLNPLDCYPLLATLRGIAAKANVHKV
jgi:hypothetical protein